MNELANGGIGIVSGAVIALLAVASLIAWFFVNRASVRASEQIRLLEALLEEQKRQNALLKRLTQSVAGQDKNAADDNEEKDFTRLIPER